MLTSRTVLALLPELVLIVSATAVYLAGAFFPNRHWGRACLLALVASAFTLYAQYEQLFWPADATQPLASVAVGGPLAIDLFGQFFRWLSLVVGALFTLISMRPGAKTPTAELSGTLLMAIAGTMIVASAQELTLLFLGLELVSIPTYVLLFLGRTDRLAQEATIKYFFLSILSSAILLYGFSFLYGISGATHLAEIRQVLQQDGVAQGGMQWLGRVALGLILAGLGFRITAVPFHFYTPDVSHGTSNANAGLLSVLPKLVGFVALTRIVGLAMVGFEPFAWRAVLVMALVTMTLGNTVALWQTNLRRMLAYSSIAHGGYVMIGLATFLAQRAGAAGAPAFDGLSAMFFYLASYGLATAGVFAALTYLGDPERQVDTLEDLAGAGRAHPVAGGVLAICLFSLAGIPPLAGFWGKLGLFFGALGLQTNTPLDRQWFLLLVLVGALNAAIGAAYYLRIIGAAYFGTSERTLPGEGGRGAAVAMVGAAVLVLAIGASPSKLQRGADSAARSLAPAIVKTAAAEGRVPAGVVAADTVPAESVAAAGL